MFTSNMILLKLDADVAWWYGWWG